MNNSFQNLKTCHGIVMIMFSIKMENDKNKLQLSRISGNY